MLAYVADRDHYEVVLKRAFAARSSLWLATANIKDAYTAPGPAGGEALSFPARLAELLRANVEVRLLHGREPGPRFLEDFDRQPILASLLERRLCPRVHCKLVIVDMRLCYVGSANITGAGLGMKGEHRRNFECGIWTDERAIVDSAVEHYLGIWDGLRCRGCLLREHCEDPIA